MSAAVLYGVTAAIGGAQLAAAACFTGTCTVTGALADMPVVVTPRTFPGNGTFWYGYVSAADTVTVKLCNAEAGFVVASIFDVAAFNSAGSGGGPTTQMVYITGSVGSGRAIATVYQNTTGKTMWVSVSLAPGLNQSVNILVKSDVNATPTTELLQLIGPQNAPQAFMFAVLAGNYYEVTQSNSNTIHDWNETF